MKETTARRLGADRHRFRRIACDKRRATELPMAHYYLAYRALLVVATILPCTASFAPVAHGDAAPAVSLRYHFTPGEILTYSMKSVETAKITIAGQPNDVDTNPVLYQSRYVVHSLDAAGNATLSIQFDPGKSTDVHNGKTTHRTIPANQLSSPSNACIQENDGTQYCVYRGGYGLND